MLLLRSVVGLTVLAQGGFYLRGPDPTASIWFAGGAGLAAGGLLLLGLLTPIAGTMAGLEVIGIGFSWLPRCSPTLLDSPLPLVFGATMLVAVIVLGPGAFSVDARLFGRREIIIPPMPQR